MGSFLFPKNLMPKLKISLHDLKAMTVIIGICLLIGLFQVYPWVAIAAVCALVGLYFLIKKSGKVGEIIGIFLMFSLLIAALLYATTFITDLITFSWIFVVIVAAVVTFVAYISEKGQ